jgi:hypothetical protein
MTFRTLIWLGSSFILAFAGAVSVQLFRTPGGSTPAVRGRFAQRGSGVAAIPVKASVERRPHPAGPKSHPPSVWGEPLRIPPLTDYDRELRQADPARAERLNNLRRAFGQSVVRALKGANCLQVKDHGYRKLQITARVESRATTAIASWSGEQFGARVVDGEPLTEAEADCARRMLVGETTLTPRPNAPFENFGGTIGERLTINQHALAQSL